MLYAQQAKKWSWKLRIGGGVIALLFLQEPVSQDAFICTSPPVQMKMEI